MGNELEAFIRARDFLVTHRNDYRTAYRDFRWPSLKHFNWALDYFDVMARDNERIALWLVDEQHNDTRLTFAEMAARSNRVANFLRAQGVRRGEVVLLMLSNVLPLWETMLACMKLGAVLTPATPLLMAEDLLDRFERGGVGHVLCGPGDTGKFAAIPGDYSRIVVGGVVEGWTTYAASEAFPADFTPDHVTDVDDPFLLYFTSGTTAKPKLVVHSYQSYPVGHLSTLYWLGLRLGDIHCNISSPGWAKHAWSNVFAPWSAGATVFVYDFGRFQPKAMLETLVRCGVTSLCAPPTVWRMLMQEDLGAYPVRIRELVGAGEPLNPEVIEIIRKAWGITIRDGYGQTETTCQIGNPPGERIKPGSMGRPMPGYTVALLDVGDQPAAEGEIALALDPRPLGLMLGYQDDPEKTAYLMRGGYYHCGDVASIDTDGYITYVGRADDVFKASDYRISPFELESALIEHEAVAEAAVVPSPDPLRLAVPKAFITLREGFHPSEELARSIFRHIRAALAPYKRIRRIEFSDLPKTVSGKIRRVALKTLEAERRAGGTRQPGEYFEEDFDLANQTPV